MSHESDKLIRAETSFVNNEMSLRESSEKPIQTKNEETAIIVSEIKDRVKDKSGGPASYYSDQPIALRNSFHVLASNEEREI